MLNFSDIYLKHNKSIVTSRSECDTTAQLGNNNFLMPVVSSNMKSVLNKDIIKLYDKNNMFYVYHRIDGTKDVFEFVKYANWNLSITSISVGVTQEWIDLVQLLSEFEFNVHYFTVDVALSYNDNIIPVLETIKKYFPNSFVIVGNGSIPDWVEWLSTLGTVNAFKMNIGVSKSCRTYEFTGFSNPTATALIECVEANIQLRDPMTVISDGGLTVENDVVYIGDIAKALVLGADWVMSGTLFSRCTDSPAIKNGYFGNASLNAKQALSRVEGDIVTVKTNGLNTNEMINRIHESLQSSISYCGGNKLKDLQIKTTYYV